MNNRRSTFLIALVLLASPMLWGQANLVLHQQATEELSIRPPAMGPGGPPDAAANASDPERPATILQLAKDIRTLPAGLPKVKAADALSHLAMQGDPGQEALQAVADTLAQALNETPQPPGKDGQPAKPYMDLARLARYEGITTTLNDPQLTKAAEILVANDADAAKAGLHVEGSERQEGHAFGAEGQDCADQFLGDLVSALPARRCRTWI